MDRRPPRGCGSGRVSEGEHDVERTARADSTIHRDAAPMLLHDALTNKEAEAHAREPAVVDVRAAVKPLENLREVGRRDSDSLVGHVDARQAVPLHDCDPDLARLRAVFHCVLDEVFEGLLYPARVVAPTTGASADSVIRRPW